jgi:hypothetical protein
LSVLIDEIEANQHPPIGEHRDEKVFFSFNFFNLNRIRTRVYAQGFVVTLLTAAAIYHAVKDRPVPHDIHGHALGSQKTSALTELNHK